MAENDMNLIQRLSEENPRFRKLHEEHLLFEKQLQELDESTRQLLAMQSAEPRLMVTMALKEMAQNAAKIGQLNISPDLLEALMLRE